MVYFYLGKCWQAPFWIEGWERMQSLLLHYDDVVVVVVVGGGGGGGGDVVE